MIKVCIVKINTGFLMGGWHEYIKSSKIYEKYIGQGENRSQGY